MACGFFTLSTSSPREDRVEERACLLPFFSRSLFLSHNRNKHRLPPLLNHAAMKPRQSALASRIRRVMLADEDVGKVAAATPALIGAGLEAFIDRLIKAAAGLAVARGDRNVTAAHL